jgi:parallel beta-helix repeat protein
MRRKMMLLLTVLLAVAMLQPTAADAAKKKPLPLETHACGDVIDSSFRLENDLTTPCSGHGLVLAPGAEKITIDLNGKRIVGDLGAGDFGIDNQTNDTARLTVKNGVIKNFGYGVKSGGERTTLVGLTASGNSLDGAALEGDNHVVKKNVFTGNVDDGISINIGAGSVIDRNTSSGNGYGIFLGTSATGATVSRNKANGNATSGIRVDGDENTVTRNTVDGNGDTATPAGIFMETASVDNVISRNLITGSGGDGYEDTGESNLAVRNTSRGNGFGGVPDGTGGGFDASTAVDPEGSKNRAVGNDNGGAPCAPASLCSADAAKKSPLPLETHTCGDPIDHSFRLENDMTTCTGHGLVLNVGAANVTIDLNGKRIAGDRGAGDKGINNTNNTVKLTVKNGVIKNFDDGVASGGARTTLVGLTLGGNATNGALLSGDGNVVKKNVFSGNDDDGLEIGDGEKSLVTGNTFSGNGFGICICTNATKATVSKNKANGNVNNGIYVTADFNTFTQNTVDGNGDSATLSGIYMSTFSKDNSLSRNTITGSGSDGYEDAGESNLVFRNVARGNGFGGTPDGTGAAFDASTATAPEGSKNKAIGNDNGGAPCAPASLCE